MHRHERDYAHRAQHVGEPAETPLSPLIGDHRDRSRRLCAGTFRPTRRAALTLIVIAGAGFLARLVAAVTTAMDGEMGALNAFGFSVVLPAVGILMILSLGPGRTREGILMRIAAVLQLIMIISVPSFALHLLLGLPVAFLAVEMFETRLPPRIREPITRMLVR